MTDQATHTDYPLEPPGPDRPGWVKAISHDIRELSTEAGKVLAGFAERFGPEAFRDPRFARAYFELAKPQGMMRVFEVVYGRAIRAREVSEFERRFSASIETVGSGGKAGLDGVPIDFAYYLPQAVEQARAQKEEGLVPDPSPVVLLIKFGTKALEDRSLSGFRVDLPAGESLVGRVFDPYELLELLGSGGFAEVYRGRHAKLNVDRALKFLRRLNLPPEEYERLRRGLVREAQVQAALDHPNVVRLLDVGEQGGLIFLVMDYVRGRTLARLIHEKNCEGAHLAPLRIVEIALEVLSGLEYAHARGIVHRDIKPENIVIDEHGRVRIVDFGLARVMAESGQQRHSRTGSLVGTPQYMAPEQVGGPEATYDHRCDLYSLGAVLYAMALGAPPFSGKDPWHVLLLHRTEEPESLAVQVEGFPEELDQIIQKCLKKRPEERYANATELMAALRECHENLTRGSAEERKSTRRTRRTALLAAGLLVMAVISAVFMLPWWKKNTPGAKAAPRALKTDAPAVSPGEIANASPLSRPVPNEEAKEAKLLLKPGPTTLADSPSSKVPEPRPADKPLPASAAKPPAPPLREKLAGYALTEQELVFVRDVLDLFPKHRPELLSKNYQPIQAVFEVLESERLGVARGDEPPPDKEYVVAQFRAAGRMVELAQGALLARLEELRSSNEKVSLVLTDGTTKSGRVKGIEKGVVILSSTEGGRARVALGTLMPESLRGQATPASAQLALLALSGSVGTSFGEIAELAGSRDDLLFWIPIAVRLARLEIEEAARAAVSARKELPTQQTGHTEALRARVVSLAKTLAEKRGEILRLFGHTRPDFEVAAREDEALRLLHGEEYARVLALGQGTAAFPVAAQVLLKRFEAEIEAAHDELHGRTGWHGYNWGLFPPEKSLKEQEKYWDPHPDGIGTILQADEIERRVAMGKGAKRAPEGILARIVYQPKAASQPAPHWRFLVRSREGASNYLRFDDASCALFRTKLESGAPDPELARAALPPKPNADGERTLALLPLEGTLHVFVDGQHVLSVHEGEAAIPMQLSIAVTQGRAWIKSVKAKKSPVEEQENR